MKTSVMGLWLPARGRGYIAVVMALGYYIGVVGDILLLLL